jgi:hypothetical protein
MKYFLIEERLITKKYNKYNLNTYYIMNAYHKYMIFYTGLQIIGVAGLMKLQEWEEGNKDKSIK